MPRPAPLIVAAALVALAACSDSYKAENLQVDVEPAADGADVPAAAARPPGNAAARECKGACQEAGPSSAGT
jgi:hypothetical protein